MQMYAETEAPTAVLGLVLAVTLPWTWYSRPRPSRAQKPLPGSGVNVVDTAMVVENVCAPCFQVIFPVLVPLRVGPGRVPVPV